MAKPQSREEFKQYCLRKLGHPVIQINVSDEQLEDRIEEALSFWQDYYFDGAQHVYLKHQLTQQDIDNGYIEIPEQMLGVVRIFDLGSSVSAGTGMFNTTYQFVLNNVRDVSGYSMQNYYMTMQHIEFMKEILVGRPLIRYNRHINRVYIDGDKSRMAVGMFIIVEGYDIIPGGDYSDIWGDRWLQNYATVLIREQWGYHLTKFTNMQLIGGVQFNGEQILNDAREERRRMEEEAINSLQPLVSNFIG